MAVFFVILVDEVEKKGGGPGEAVRTIAFSRNGIEVFMEAEADGQLNQILLHGVRFFPVAVIPESLGEHPVDVDPHGASPVIPGIEIIGGHVVVGDGENSFPGGGRRTRRSRSSYRVLQPGP